MPFFETYFKKYHPRLRLWFHLSCHHSIFLFFFLLLLQSGGMKIIAQPTCLVKEGFKAPHFSQIPTNVNDVKQRLSKVSFTSITTNVGLMPCHELNAQHYVQACII